MAHGVDQLSWVTLARVRRPSGSTSSPGRLFPVSEAPRCGQTIPVFPGDSCPGPRARGFDQLSRVTCDMVGDPRVDQPFQTTQARARYPTVSTSIQGDSGPCPRGLQPGSEGLRSGPALPGHSRLRPKACGFDLLSQGNRGQVRGPEGSTSCPRGLGPVPDFQQGRSAFPDASRMCPSARGEDQQFQVLGFQGTQGRPDVFGDSGPVPRSHGVEQVSKATRACYGGPTGQPDVPGNSGPAPRACGLDQLSRATRTCVQGPTWSTRCWGTRALVRSPEGSTSCHGGLKPVPEGKWGPSVVPGILALGLKARVFDQLSRATGAWVRVPGGRPALPCDSCLCPRTREVDPMSLVIRALVRGPAGSTWTPGHLGPMPKALQSQRDIPVRGFDQLSRATGDRGQPAAWEVSGPGVRARVVDQQSRATHTYVLEFVGSTSCPGRLGPGPKSPWGRLAVPGDSDPGPRSCGVDRLSRGTQDRGDALPGDSRLGPSARGVDQCFRVTRAIVRGPKASTSCPMRLGPESEVRRGCPAVPRGSGPVPSACVVDHLFRLSRKTRDLVGGPALSTSCPRRLRPVREGLRCPQLFRATRTVPEGPGVEPLSRATRDLVRGPRGSTNCPRRLGTVPEVPQCRPTLPAVMGDWGPGPKALVVDQLSRVTRDLVGGPRVDQPFRTTQARARYPTVSTSIQGDSGPCPSSPWDSHLCLSARGVYQPSRVTRVRAPGPARSTRYLWRLGPSSEGPRGRPGLKGDSGP
ncbi:collagen alpha-2(I) chain-like [Sus scrofa]|uniref:collagen alpha-2(I) chain-like n=1 Tax=Sus scrofa TaxID=9823 RepID=UPI000A2B0B8A|nr:collagen alpha-2(I) chain-like [Sus scrofa]